MRINLKIIIVFALCYIHLGYSQKKSKKFECLARQLEVILPGNFYRMSDETVNIKYPYGRNKPQEVYTTKLTKVNFTTSLRTTMPTQEKHLPEVKTVLLNNLRKANTIKQHKLLKINGKQFVIIEFVSQGLDKKIYNILYASNLNGKLLIGNFNFPNDEYSKWYSKGKSVINSIRIQ